MRLRIALAILIGLSAVTYVVATRVDSVEWRLKVLRLKATGGIEDLRWGELLTMLRPSSDVHLKDLADTGNPFVSIRNSHETPADREAGANLFRLNCAGCHGLEARGSDQGPDLVGAARKHGDSPWATFRVLQHGIEGTAMPAMPLADKERWQVIAYLDGERRGGDDAEVDSSSTKVPNTFSVSSQRLVDAASEPQNWLTYSGLYNGWRHSTLDTLNRDSVKQLQLAWVRQFDTSEWVETSPIVVDGIMFFTEPPSNVWAVDAATGEVIWVRKFEIPDKVSTCCGRVNRGVAVMNDRVFVGTLDGRLVALEARTGKPVWQSRVFEPGQGYSITTAPLAARDKIVIGVAGGEYGVRGMLDAYDAGTGKRAWRFETIPAPGQPGHETWGGSNVWQTGGGPTWVPGAFDPELGLLYWGVGNPSPDFDASVRPGDNLYTNSVVALDIESGKLAWHFQFTPADTHDYDANQTPMLVDYQKDGTTQRLILWANRNGFYYALNRENGKFILARPFARQNWAARIDEQGRPVVNPEAIPSAKGVLVWPSAAGATNWQPPSYSPLEDRVFVAYREQPSVFFSRGGEVTDRPEGERQWLGSATHYAIDLATTGVRAIAPLTGEVMWQHEMPQRRKSSSRLYALNKIGGIATTAGGLLFIGNVETFYALDSRNGETLWEANLGGIINAAPVTYSTAGRQFVVIAAGSAIYAFASPHRP